MTDPCVQDVEKGNDNGELGHHIQVSLLVCRPRAWQGKAEIPLDDARELACAICKAVEMRHEGLHAALWTFPAFDQGGEGWTFVQPIITSFLALDKWTFLDGTRALYLHLVSCKPFDRRVVIREIDAAGLEVVDQLHSTLSARVGA